MIFDSCGLPRDTGATDFMDSASRAGLMALFDAGFDPSGLCMYLDHEPLIGFVGRRHPFEVPSNNYKNFTRDQLVCLAAGLWKGGGRYVPHLYENAVKSGNRAQNTEKDVVGSTKKFPDGADWLSPSVMNHLRLCSGLKPTVLGTAWLIMDIVYHSLFTPLREPNQLICMCVVAGPKYVKLFKKLNSKWKQGITDYWSGWRGEPLFAQIMIDRLTKI